VSPKASLLIVLAACARHAASMPDAVTHLESATDPRLAAAANVAANDPRCTKIRPFYWEIGDATHALVSGQVHTRWQTPVTATTRMNLASASKLVFGAYAVERFKDDLSRADARAMTMRSGYVSLRYRRCKDARTVDDCLAGVDGEHTPDADDRFDYNGGHFQRYAHELGLGGDDDAKLAADVRAVIGPELALAYGSPQLAAGVVWTPDGYARFLRKIVSGRLAIHDHLRDGAVCTKPGSAGCDAIASPAPYAWHYAWGHWIEDDASAGDDGAYSSPGAFGFYPWIDASARYYGIVARDVEGWRVLGAYKESAACGRAIRMAFEHPPS
jgi:hypothetical protein